MTTHDEQLGTVAEIMKDTRVAVLTYVSPQGALVSLPMATQDFEEPGRTWFITDRSSDKVGALEADPRVNVAYHGKGGWVSLSGTARISQDPDKLRDLWDTSVEVFMEGGPDDPGTVLIEVDGATAEYWESPGKVSGAIQLVKGLVTDERPDLGDNDTVVL